MARKACSDDCVGVGYQLLLEPRSISLLQLFHVFWRPRVYPGFPHNPPKLKTQSLLIKGVGRLSDPVDGVD